MIPLSDAWIEYPSEAGPQVSFCGTIVVNREMADSIQLDRPPPSAAPVVDTGDATTSATGVAAA